MNVLFVFAHPDDESFGPAGTIARHVEQGDNVWVMSLCKGDRPGNEQVQGTRQESFNLACDILGVTPILCDSNDGWLNYQYAVKQISDNVNEIKPQVVYTHNISDIHIDHRTTAEAVMVACRPKAGSSVKRLLMCENAVTDWTFGQIEPVFVANVFHDVSKHIHKKAQVMGLYQTEVYEHPDARSIQSMRLLSMNRGKQVGMEYAEAFKLVYDIN